MKRGGTVSDDSPKADSERNVAHLEQENPALRARLELVESRYRALFQGASEALFVTDFVSGGILDANAAACRMFGAALPQLQGLRGRQLHPESESDKVLAVSQALVQSGHGRCERIRCARIDGTVFWGSVATSVYGSPGRSVIIVILHDVSERVAQEREVELARQELARSEERYRAVVSSAADALLVADFDTGRFIEANPAATELLGYSAEELAQMTGRMLHPPIQMEYVDRVSADLIDRGEAARTDAVLRRKDGSLLWAELRARTFDAGGRKLYVTVVRDVIERVLRERELVDSYAALRATQAQLLEASKQSAIGQLAGGVAHELNQPLTAIRGFAERVRARTSGPRQELDIIVTEAERMARIIDNLRMFARQNALELERIDPLVPVEAAVALVGAQLQELGFDLRRAVPLVLPSIQGDRFKLQQVFLNLLTNARDALAERRGGGTIVVRARQLGDHVEVAVENDGPTIPDALRDKLFEPFFTTKEPNQGTGLGLSISYGIVRDHDGEIRHEVREGGGARFVVRLPAVTP